MSKSFGTVGTWSRGGDYPHKALTQQTLGCAITVHRALGPGFLESVYENALAHELGKQGLTVQRQVPTQIVYDGVVCGEHRLDILVDSKVIVELKNVDALHDRHLAQVISTLRAFSIRVGLLMNFNEATLTQGVRRVILSDT